MKKSKITQTYTKKRNWCLFASIISWFGTCGFLVIYGLCTAFKATGEASEVGTKLMDIFMPLIVSYAIAICLVIFIREKMRNTVWLVNVVLSAMLLGDTFMYITIALFALDEFIVNPLYKYYSNKVSINVELDKRSC